MLARSTIQLDSPKAITSPSVRRNPSVVTGRRLTRTSHHLRWRSVWVLAIAILLPRHKRRLLQSDRELTRRMLLLRQNFLQDRHPAASRCNPA